MHSAYFYHLKGYAAKNPLCQDIKKLIPSEYASFDDRLWPNTKKL